MKRSLILKTLIASSLLCGAITFAVGTTNSVENTVEQAEAADYYSTIDDSLSGDDLRNALHTLNASKRKSTVSYAGFRTFAAKCDVNPDSGNKIVGFYDNTLVGPSWDSGNTWNREHVWPNSLGGSLVEADAHMIRPASTAINSDRGNMYYGSSGSTYDPGQYVAAYRGIAARIIFYSAIADTSLNIIDANSGGSNKMGKLSDLLTWNLQYLPGTSTLELRTEQNRNNVIEQDSSGQGNRNPFIDHPEYACKIWGNTNSTTQSICAAAMTGITSISKTEASLSIGNTTTISAVSSNSETISWSSDTTSVATVSSNTAASGSSVTITAVAAGTAKIKASITISGKYYEKVCIVTVTDPSQPSITFDKIQASITVGNTTTITATTQNISGNLTWTSSNTNVATVSSSGVVTGVATGNATITASYGNSASATCAITVTAASSGGTLTITRSSFNTSGGYAWYDWTQATSDNTSISGKAELYTTTTTSMQFNKNKGNKVAAIFNTTALPGPITKIEATTDSGTNRVWNAYTTSTACSASGSTLTFGSSKTTVGSNVTITTSSTSLGTSASGHYYFCLQENESNASYLSEIVITYSGSSTPVTPTLSSIAVKTAPTKTTYTAGEYFDPTGLVITRTYSNNSTSDHTYAGHTSDFSFNPSTSTALKTTDTSVTITYGGKDCSQAITVNEASPGELTASLNEENEGRIFYVGEYISNDDLDVKKGSVDLYDEFLLEGSQYYSYTFTYDDAPSGGGIGNKTFEITDLNETCSCSLTVQVQRKARVAPSSESDSLTASDFNATTTSYVGTTGINKSSGAVYAGNTAKNYSAIQLRSSDSSGIVSTTSGGQLTSITVSWQSSTTNGRVLSVYGKTSAYSSAGDLYSSNTQGTLLGTIVKGTSTSLTITGSYTYIGLRSSSGAMYLSSITINYGSSDSAINLSNYIMYEDTNNQCTSKFNTAKGYFNNLTSEERQTFMTSDDYIIDTARDRLEAWAANRGESITYSNNDYVISGARQLVIFNGDSNLLTIGLVLITLGSLIYAGTFVFKKKEK